MNCSMPGLPVHHQLPEFTQTHVHRVSDAIQPSHPLSSPSPVAPNPLPASESFPMSQLFAWGGQSTGVSALASFLPKNLIIFILLMRKVKQRESKQLTYGHLEKVELGFKHRQSWYRICALYHKQCCFLYNSDSKTLRFKPWLDYVLTE